VDFKGLNENEEGERRLLYNTVTAQMKELQSTKHRSSSLRPASENIEE